MKKLALLSFAAALMISSANAEDCIMAKELNVEFKNDSTKYMDPTKEMNKIGEFADFAKQTDIYVLIEGHTNSLSTATHNLDLSDRRAKTVKNELVNMGIKSDHIKSKGFGEALPLYDNTTDEGLEKNRRVRAEVFGSADELSQYLQAQTKQAKAYRE